MCFWLFCRGGSRRGWIGFNRMEIGDMSTLCLHETIQEKDFGKLGSMLCNAEVDFSSSKIIDITRNLFPFTIQIFRDRLEIHS